MMIIIYKLIESLFVRPKRPKFVLDSQKHKTICLKYVSSNATQGSRDCQFSKTKQTFSLMCIMWEILSIVESFYTGRVVRATSILRKNTENKVLKSYHTVTFRFKFRS